MARRTLIAVAWTCLVALQATAIGPDAALGHDDGDGSEAGEGLVVRRTANATYEHGRLGDVVVVCGMGIGGECFDAWKWETHVVARADDAGGAPVGVRIQFLNDGGDELAMVEQCPWHDPAALPAGTAFVRVWVNGAYHNAEDCQLPGLGGSEGTLRLTWFGSPPS